MDYEVIKIRTAVTKNELDSGLSFMEGGQDIPFSIDRYIVFMSRKEISNVVLMHENTANIFYSVRMEKLLSW